MAKVRKMAVLMHRDNLSSVHRVSFAAVAAAAALAACGPPASEMPTVVEDTWSVTVWGKQFEVFPEVGALVAGATAVAYTHVTRLDGYTPLADGAVEVVLSGPSGEHVFAVDHPARAGIFTVEIEPPSPGEFDLAFRIRDAEGSEEIRGGRVRVGTTEQSGGLIVAPIPKAATDTGEPLPFLKEEQWRSDFNTVWVRSGRLARGVAGLARVRPPAGGEVTVTSPVDGVLLLPADSRPWPFEGLRINRGGTLFQVAPRVAENRSLAVLEADLATLTAELEHARMRLSRLEELLALEAASRREVDDTRTTVETLEARHFAAARDLEAARAAREGGAAGASLRVRAPFTGEVARVNTSPGATVAAGEALARMVRTDAVWIEIAASPGDARQIAEEGVRGVVLTDPEAGPTRLEQGLRLVSVAPELSPETGTVKVILEVTAANDLVLGTTLEAQVLTDREHEGIVVPASALVDDGGVAVVYLQLAGESFARQQVQVLERQGDRLLVEGLIPGQRLVVAGGDAIRRSSLMAGGEAHGHVH